MEMGEKYTTSIEMGEKYTTSIEIHLEMKGGVVVVIIW
jgi:hypothetical protein